MLWFKKRKFVDNQGVITPEMREKALETRRINHRIEQLEKRLEQSKQLEILEQAVGGGSSNKMEDMLLTMLMTSFLKPQQQNTQSSLNSPMVATPSSEGVSNPQQNQKIAEFLKRKVSPEILQTVKDMSINDLIDVKMRLEQ